MGYVCFLFTSSRPSRLQSRALGLASWPVGCNQGSVMAKGISPGVGNKTPITGFRLTSHCLSHLLVSCQSWRESGEARSRLPSEPHQVLPCPAQVSISLPPPLMGCGGQDQAPLRGLRPSRSLPLDLMNNAFIAQMYKVLTMVQALRIGHGDPTNPSTPPEQIQPLSIFYRWGN